LPSSSDLSLDNFLLWRASQQKLCRRDNQMLIICSTVCYNTGSDKLVLNERVTRLTGKKSSGD